MRQIFYTADLYKKNIVVFTPAVVKMHNRNGPASVPDSSDNLPPDSPESRFGTFCAYDLQTMCIRSNDHNNAQYECPRKSSDAP